MTKRLLKVAFAVAAIALCPPTIRSHAQQASAIDAIPDYQPQPIAAGVIRSWGHVFLKNVMASWELNFQKYHPDITFSDNLVSSAAAAGALFTNTRSEGRR